MSLCLFGAFVFMTAVSYDYATWSQEAKNLLNILKQPLQQSCNSVAMLTLVGLSLCIRMHCSDVVVISLWFADLPQWLLQIGFGLPSLYCRGSCTALTQWYRAYAQHKQCGNIFLQLKIHRNNHEYTAIVMHSVNTATVLQMHSEFIA